LQNRATRRDNRRLSARETAGRGAISRRGLIGGAAAGAAGYTLAGGASAKAKPPRRVDVVIVGAGFAGLAAARELQKAGASFVVLEARGRVGGRTLNRRIPGKEIVEIGGQWVGPTQDRVLALIDDLGLKTFKTYAEGENVYYRSDNPGPLQLQTYTGTIPPANPASLGELQLVITQLDSMAQEVPPEAPWEAPRAAEWDGQTFETWKLANTGSDEARDLVDLAIEAVFAAEPRDISLLHVLFYIRSAGSFNHLIDTGGGAQDSRVVGGSQLIALRLAKRLGRSLVLRAPVRRIDHGAKGVEVETPRGPWRAEQAILAIPPTLAGRIEYRPQLPAGRDQITQRFPMGSVVKCMAVYDEPFWRGDGLSGMATSDTGPVKVTFDNSPPDGRPGVLLGFVEGQEAREFTRLERGARRAAVLDSLARYFGDRARSAVAYEDKSWAEDQWTRGCYGGFAAPGVITGYRGALRDPVGRLHWAGTETATVWNGYMDGAVESGQRAAAEVLKAL
jgi:monoamine oxidase